MVAVNALAGNARAQGAHHLLPCGTAVPIYRDDIAAMPWLTRAYQHQAPVKRSILPWWSVAALGLLLLALAMLPGDGF